MHITKIDPATQERLMQVAKEAERLLPGYHIVLCAYDAQAHGAVLTDLDNEATVLVLRDAAAFFDTKEPA